jgi:hypothetical protein
MDLTQVYERRESEKKARSVSGFSLASLIAGVEGGIKRGGGACHEWTFLEPLPWPLHNVKIAFWSVAEVNVLCQFPFVTSGSGYCLLVEGTFQQNDKAGFTRNPGIPRYKGQRAHLGGNPRAPWMKKCEERQYFLYIHRMRRVLKESSTPFFLNYRSF